PDGVVTLAGDDMVVALGALDNDMLFAVVAQVAPSLGISATLDHRDKRLPERVLVLRILKTGHRKLPGEVDVEHAVRSSENVAGDGTSGLLQVRVPEHHLGERVAFQLGDQV